MAIVEVSVIPIGTGSASLSRFVARALEVLEEAADLKYELTPMGTVIEGDLVRIMDVVVKMHRSAFTDGCVRVVTTLKIDERRDKPQTMSDKVESVRKQRARRSRPACQCTYGERG